ncbi:MAG: GNAT family N-acetyltransferase [Natronomonas sp.]
MTEIRAAVPSEYVTARSIFEAALLEVDRGLLRRSLVLLACEDDRILGALILRGSEVEAIAVRPGRRGQGIGSMLVHEAANRRPCLSAGFDPDVRPFYTALGFDVVCEDGRCRGVYKR